MVVLLGGYFLLRSGGTQAVTSAMVVHQVTTGPVSTGIQTTGKVKAAEILDLNVYKLASRIDVVHVENGTHVDVGDLLFSFDQSDSAVAIANSQLKLRDAQLGLEVAQQAAGDPNTTITTLKNDISVLEQNLLQYQDDLRTGQRDFFNADLTAEPGRDRYDQQVEKAAPTIGGLYNNSERGAYLIKLYASNEKSGLSYTLSGLESGSYPVYPGVETPLGTRGLTITFPSSGISNQDVWVIAVPNTYDPDYPKNKEAYDDTVRSINDNIDSDTVLLENKRTQLAKAQRSDTNDQRDLMVQTAALAVDQAKVDLQKHVDTGNERRIIAPFVGTVEGMENVVVGATPTPTKDSNDPIDLGSIISDEFLVTFSLGANDVDKVSLGQKVRVTLTSVPNSSPLDAVITEVSSLPDTNTVAQYSVSARIDTGNLNGLNLRDGMLADVEIVQEEKTNVVRIPVSAVQYQDGTAYVTVLEGLSDQQKQQASRMGIVRTDVTNPTEVERKVTLGLRGSFYAEVTDGLVVGDLVKVSGVSGDANQAPVVQNARFGPGTERVRTSRSNGNSNSSSQGGR